MYISSSTQLDGRTHFIPGTVKRELRMVLGLLFLVEVPLAAPYSDVVYCGDSSTHGYAFHWTPSHAAEQRPLFRFHERWRFVEVESDFGRDLRGHSSWDAGLCVPDLAYTRWLAERCGLPKPDGVVLVEGTKEVKSRSKECLDLVGLVPKLPASLVQSARWRTVIQRKWKHPEAIHMKEAGSL